jgi:hypothetical protein
LFSFDEVFARYFLFALLAAALWRHPLWHLGVLSGLQIWYSAFILWHRPHRTLQLFLSDLIPQIGSLVVFCSIWVLGVFNNTYELLVLISFVAFLTVLVTALLPIIFIFVKTGDEEDETTPLIRPLNE